MPRKKVLAPSSNSNSIVHAPLLQWEQEAQYLSASDRTDAKKDTVAPFASTGRTIYVAQQSAQNWIVQDAVSQTIGNRTNHCSETCIISPSDVVAGFNHFDLPFGCQQPTAAHADILAHLVQPLLLPETPLPTVVSFLRQMYHASSTSGQAKLFRFADLPLLGFNFGDWQHHHAWLKEYDLDSWWSVSEEFAVRGFAHEALLCHYQAMPTIKDFEKTLKELCNYENTSDGRWLPKEVTSAARTVRTSGIGVSVARINLQATTTILDQSCWLQTTTQQTVVNTVKTVERFLCTLLMVYRLTCANDVIKNIDTQPQNLYLGNADFDVIEAHRMSTVRAYHYAQSVPTMVVWDHIDAPLLSPSIQSSIAALSVVTLGNMVGVVSNETQKATSKWYTAPEFDSCPVRWLCFASTPQVVFPTPLALGDQTLSSTQQWCELLSARADKS